MIKDFYVNRKEGAITIYTATPFDKEKYFYIQTKGECANLLQEGYVKVKDLPQDSKFFKYNKGVNKHIDQVASHSVIEKHILECGQDYRNEDKENPIKELRDRKKDNTTFAR